MLQDVTDTFIKVMNGKNKNYWNYIFADIVLTCIPVIIVYMIGQKYIVGWCGKRVKTK